MNAELFPGPLYPLPERVSAEKTFADLDERARTFMDVYAGPDEGVIAFKMRGPQGGRAKIIWLSHEAAAELAAFITEEIAR